MGTVAKVRNLCARIILCIHNTLTNLTVSSYRTSELIEIKNKWSDAMRDQGVDILVYPALPLPAFKHGLSVFLSAALSYMFISNLLDWPSGVVPVTTVRADEAHYRKKDLPENQRDSTAEPARKPGHADWGLRHGARLSRRKVSRCHEASRTAGQFSRETRSVQAWMLVIFKLDDDD
jgi:hypothetical protein